MTTISNIRPPYNEETNSGLRVFQASWAALTFAFAVSSLKGGRMLEIVVILLLQHLSYYLLCKI